MILQKTFRFKSHLSPCLRSGGKRGGVCYSWGVSISSGMLGESRRPSSKEQQKLAVRQAGRCEVPAGRTDTTETKQVSLTVLLQGERSKFQGLGCWMLGCWHLHWHYTSGCKRTVLEELCIFLIGFQQLSHTLSLSLSLPPSLQTVFLQRQRHIYILC